MPIVRNSRISGPTRAERDAEPATPRQVTFLHDLARQRYVLGETVTAEEAIAIVDTGVADGMTKAAASALISAFQTAAPRPGATGSRPGRGDYYAQPADRYMLGRLRDAAARRCVFGDEHTREQTIAMMEERIAAGLTRAEANDLNAQAWRAPAHRTPDDPIFLDDLYAADATLPMVEDGYYALEQEDAVRFFRVWTPTSGRFANRRLIARYSSDRADVLYRTEAIETITAIAVDPIEAATRFARLETRCYHCGKRLTDHLSRLLLIGPDCRGFTGTGVYRPLRELPDTEENQDKFTAFLRACREHTEHESMQEALAQAAEWYAVLPEDLPFADALTRLTALLGGGYTPANTRENPELWTMEESRLAGFAALRNLFGGQ